MNCNYSRPVPAPLTHPLVSVIDDKKDLKLDLTKVEDLISLNCLKDVCLSRVQSELDFFLAVGVDKIGTPFFYDSSSAGNYWLKHKKEVNPLNRQDIRTAAVYKYCQTSEVFKFFCSKTELSESVYFACIIAENDPSISLSERAEAFKILANCYYFGKGGASKDEAKAEHYRMKYQSIVDNLNNNVKPGVGNTKRV